MRLTLSPAWGAFTAGETLWGADVTVADHTMTLTALPREIKASLPQVYEEHLAFFRTNLEEIGFKKRL